MYKVLEENVMLKIDNKLLTALTAVLTGVSGGKQVIYVTADGTIVKTEAYSLSKYGKDAKSV
jgi:hypothetical protein